MKTTQLKNSVHTLRPVAAALVLGMVSSGAVWAAGEPDPTRLSLEELMGMEVSTAARKPQALADTAAAVHVITREDIRRSGATSLPEVLRLAPGVQVSRIDASRYAITIRGFASRYAGKILVLQDGRTLFSPMFNGTFWESQDPMLEDIERIEVIRGPGGTLWGANAVNGVINIISRKTEDTQGTLVAGQAGSVESGLAVRHGGTLGDDGHFRVYGKRSQHDALTDGSSAAHDALVQERAGFRVDLKPSARDRLTIQGDVHHVRADVTELETSLSTTGTVFKPDTQVEKGANLLLRWERQVNAGNEIQVQAFADRVVGKSKPFDLEVDTLDLDFQQRLRLNATHELTWGAGWRHISDKTRGSLTLTFDPVSSQRDIYSAFVQDEMTLAKNLRLTLGSKFEHNEVTGLEVQPSARVHWQATPTDNFWAAVSRAVETPSRATLDSQINYRVDQVSSALLPPPYSALPSPVTVLSGMRGSDGVVAQALLAREIGYRGLFGSNLSVDLTLFHHSYDHIVSLEKGTAQWTGSYIFQPYNFDNRLGGSAYGLEVAGTWQASPDWRLSASLSTLRMKLTPTSGGSGTSAFGGAGDSPAYMAQLHSQYSLAHNLDLDAHLYRNTALRNLGIPAYTRLDLRLGWRVRPGVELSLTGRNLLQGSHREFKASDFSASDIPRSWVLQGNWKF